MNKPIYEVSDVINRALAEKGIECDTVTGSQSVEYHITHEGRKISFFMHYDEE